MTSDFIKSIHKLLTQSSRGDHSTTRNLLDLRFMIQDHHSCLGQKNSRESIHIAIVDQSTQRTLRLGRIYIRYGNSSVLDHVPGAVFFAGTLTRSVDEFAHEPSDRREGKEYYPDQEGVVEDDAHECISDVCVVSEVESWAVEFAHQCAAAVHDGCIGHAGRRCG